MIDRRRVYARVSPELYAAILAAANADMRAVSNLAVVLLQHALLDLYADLPEVAALLDEPEPKP